MSSIHKRKRILHITFNMGFGGTEQVIRQLVMNLPADSYENQILCIDGHVGAIGEQVAAEGTEVFALNRRAGLDRELIGKIRGEVRNRNIDIIHCHQYTPWVYGWFARWGTGAKLVFTEHGRFHPDRYRYKAVAINPVMALTTDAIVAISKATRKALSRYEFVPLTKIRVIYNGIRGFCRDEEAAKATRQALNIPDSSFVMGTIARLDSVKNQSMMLESFSTVLNRDPEAWLLLVGDGPERNRLERQADDLGIRHRVVFTGFQKQPEKYLNVMDLFLLPSHTEGTSMTLLEAMSMGVPIVATAVGGTPELVRDRRNGRLTNAGDGKAFGSILSEMSGDSRTSLKLMAANGQQDFNKYFSIKTMINEYGIIYDKITGKRDG